MKLSGRPGAACARSCSSWCAALPVASAPRQHVDAPPPRRAQRRCHAQLQKQPSLGALEAQLRHCGGQRESVCARAAIGLDGVAVHTEFQPQAKPGFFTVKGRLTLQADPAVVWQVLTDYESSAAVFSSIQACEVAVSEDGRKELLQKCGWRFLTFSGAFDCRLSVDEDHDSQKLTFNLVESSFMRDFEGRWHVQQAPQQQQQQQQHSSDGGCEEQEEWAPAGGCVVEHVLSVKPLMPVPPPFSYYTRSIFCKQVEAVLWDLQREVERLEAERPRLAEVQRIAEEASVLS